MEKYQKIASFTNITFSVTDLVFQIFILKFK